MTSVLPVPPERLPINRRVPLRPEQSGLGDESFADVLAQLLGGTAEEQDIGAGDKRVAQFTGAEMFNEDGLFHGGVQRGEPTAITTEPQPDPAQYTGATATVAGNTAAPVVIEASPTPPVPHSIGAVVIGDQAGRRATTNTNVLPAILNADRIVTAVSPRFAGATGAQAEILVPEVGFVTPDKINAIRIPLQSSALPQTDEMPETRAATAIPDEQGTTFDIQLSVQGTEAATHVTAQMNGTSHAERSRLRDRIVALLARHGLKIGNVRVGGRGGVSDAGNGDQR